MSADPWIGVSFLTPIVGLSFSASGSFSGEQSTKEKTMPGKTLLRTLVSLEIVLTIVGLIVSEVTVNSLPQPLQEYLAQDAEAEFTAGDWLFLMLSIPFLLLWLTSSVGLLFLWRPARLLYTVAVLGCCILSLFLGPAVYSAAEQFLSDLASLIPGAIIALLYWSPLKAIFDKSTPPSLPMPAA
jgi:hypothetical protein